MSLVTPPEILALSSQVLLDSALEPALLPVLGLLRMELKRVGLTLGKLQALQPAHQPAAGYSRREWRQSLVDRSLADETSARSLVLVLEFTAEGFTEGSVTLLVEERPQGLDGFDWSRQCRSKRLLATRCIVGWAELPDPLDAVHSAFSSDGLFAPLEAVRADVVEFVQGFQP